MKKTRPPTSSDVARLAGVSKSAVSRAYNSGYVASAARERIFEAAEKLRYRPSIAARALSTQKSKLIGLVITALDNLFYPELVDSLSARLSADGYRCVIFETHGEVDLEPVVDELLGYRLDGVIFASTSHAVRAAVECSSAGVPAIMMVNVDLGRQVAGITADNRHGAESVAQHFVDQGCERVGVINGLEESSASVERTRYFLGALSDAGVRSPRIIGGGYTFEGAREATRSMLVEPEPIEAIFCVTSMMALGCLQEIQERGLVPGRDVAVAGFDDVAVASWPAFSLTSYRTPLSEMVEICASRLMDAIESAGQLENHTSVVRGELVVRRSSIR